MKSIHMSEHEIQESLYAGKSNTHPCLCKENNARDANDKNHNCELHVLSPFKLGKMNQK